MASSFAFCRAREVAFYQIFIIGSLLQPIGYSCSVGFLFTKKYLEPQGFGHSEEKLRECSELSSIGKSTTRGVWIRCMSRVSNSAKGKIIVFKCWRVKIQVHYPLSFRLCARWLLKIFQLSTKKEEIGEHIYLVKRKCSKFVQSGTGKAGYQKVTAS